MIPDLPTTPKALRARLARDLGQGGLPRGTWEALEEGGYVEDYFRKCDAAQYRIILKRARKPEPGRPGRKLGQKSGNIKVPPFHRLELLRSDCFSSHMRRLALRRPEVHQLRQDLFAGATLSPNQAGMFCRQIAPRLFAGEWFVENGIPLVGHRSRYIAPSHGRGKKRSQIVVELPDGARRIEDVEEIEKTAKAHGVMVRLGERGFFTAPGSVWGCIQRVATLIAPGYGWTIDDAVWFLITDIAPRTSPISLTPHWEPRVGHFRLTAVLEFEPWVTDETVRWYFRYARRKALGSQKPLMKERAIRLCDFVEGYRLETLKKEWKEFGKGAAQFPWKTLFTIWGNRYPRWKYRNVAELRTAFKKASRELIWPLPINLMKPETGLLNDLNKPST